MAHFIYGKEVIAILHIVLAESDFKGAIEITEGLFDLKIYLTVVNSPQGNK